MKGWIALTAGVCVAGTLVLAATNPLSAAMMVGDGKPSVSVVEHAQKRGYCSTMCDRARGCGTCRRLGKVCLPNKKSCEGGGK